MSAVDLSRRVVEPERMDDPALDPKKHQHALRGLARLNHLSRAPALLWPLIRRGATKVQGRRVRVLDLACGGGDVTARLALWAQHQGLPIDIQGCDVSKTAIGASRATAERYHSPAVFFRHDVMAEGVPPGYDIAVASLFIHHLSDEQATELLISMKREASCGLISDLERSTASLRMIRWASRLVTRSSVVHHDAASSVAAAFTVAEMKSLATKAGLDHATVTTRFPCRLLTHWGVS